ncbi:SAC3 domain-containing protein 1 [Teleopsis dalmanni]|uniref:SAC3 domain-containing protein 1 n=1 Tax=Teleopsis dalmanni TaxID=139649 RepID=UPI0018CDA76E|nr:SAC3 domain-containing protein 1 [Teleopsis dalmanni]
MSTFVKGTCEKLCPDNETKLRTKEKVLHFYEYSDVKRKTPGTLVKCFSRSAAGIKLPTAKDIRTEQCLHRTLAYLLKDILLDKRKSFNFAYNFIFDRLRAVRQEAVMQNFNNYQSIKLLEPIIMFLAYSRYRLCEEPIDFFDPKICDQHLQECLKRVLCAYDTVDITKLNLNELRNRNFIEALYQIFNLGSAEALQRSFTLPLETRLDAYFKNAVNISKSYTLGNYYRAFDGIKNLPHLLCAIAALKLPEMRRQLYLVFAHAYNSKALTVSADFVRSLTLHKCLYDLFEECKYYNMKIVEEQKSLRFIKNDFKVELPPSKPKHEDIVENKLRHIFLPEVLLMKKI